ncbi:hypothetical protein AB0J72_08515 [Dactylosporangium sp. NPDC049742]|uniref:hypothetical protein n=1 Tax=Dactylosporangium sp. NPDC049742 TaxID=3154737 RepID=UPI00341A2208
MTSTPDPLSVQQRQAVIDDFVATVFDGVTDPDGMVVAGWMRELPTDLPDDPADARSVARAVAWQELADLVAGTAFRRKVRTMVLSDPRLEFGLNIRPLVLEHAGGAVDRGVAAGSPEARAIVHRIVPADLPAEERAAFVRWLELVADPRVERYWQLLAVLHGTDPGPAAVPAYAWLLDALRAVSPAGRGSAG